VSYLSLTDADREAMLATIGVASLDELFRDIPAAMRYGHPLDVPPALTEAELQRHLEELAAKNVVDEICFLGAGIYDHHVPAVVDAVLQRGELLTAYTPYQPEMSQGVLQAIFEYQTAICELTGMDVSNASGYDGTTVAADACFVAKHATGRSKIVVTEATNPQVRQVIKTYAPGFGLEIIEVPHEGGVTDPERVREAAVGAAAVIFQQPNFFGNLENAPELAAAANDAGAMPIAHVDLVSLGVLEAPGEYGCAMAIGEGQSAGNSMSYGGPHYGFLAARNDYIRHVKTFTAFLGRSPDTATAEDLRRFQVHQTSSGVRAPSMNSSVAALRFYYGVTLDQPSLARHLTFVGEPRKIPVILSQEEVVRLLEAAPGPKYKAAVATGR